MERYSLIDTKFPREFLLLQGRGCRWRGCSFCDYYGDVSSEPFGVNSAVLAQVTGKYGVLDIINSGSAMELDELTLKLIEQIVRQKKIHTLWFEAHYMYRHTFDSFAARFAPAEVKFRCGIESFDGGLRLAWNKGVAPEVAPEDVARYFRGVCLLVGVEGQTRQQILSDVALARQHFDYFSVNLFCPNSTPIRRDEELSRWVVEVLAPQLADDPKAELLIVNTDLGVG